MIQSAQFICDYPTGGLLAHLNVMKNLKILLSFLSSSTYSSSLLVNLFSGVWTS